MRFFTAIIGLGLLFGGLGTGNFVVAGIGFIWLICWTCSMLAAA